MFEDILYIVYWYPYEFFSYKNFMLREEMVCFWWQLETKIMNEGWASYWHIRIMRELNLDSNEAIEYAKLNAGIVQPSKTSINPYYLGLRMFEDIEYRYNNPTKEMKELGVKSGSGREKMFEVRELESDSSFIRNYLTKELVMREDMYLFQRQGKEYKVTDKAWENVRDQLVVSRVNGGFPYIVVQEGDYLKNGELYLKHSYEHMELDVKYVEKVMPYIHQLWGRGVHLETNIENKSVLFSYDGKNIHRKYI